MSITEAVIQKMNALPPEKQERVLEFVETIERQDQTGEKSGTPHEWLDIALGAGLNGPKDWSENLDEYLYGNKKHAG